MGDAVPKTKPRKRGNSSPWMPRLRKRGEKLLHSKYVVILVIILTITDCSLVIAELILDLYSVKKTLLATEDQTYTFIRSVRTKYPEEVRSNDTVFAIFERIAQATIVWNNSKELDFHQKSSNIHPELTTVGSIGMTLPSLSGFASLQDKTEATLKLHSHDVLVQRGNNLTFVSNRHFRRQSQASNSTFRSSNPKDNNENLIRTTKAKFFRSILRVKRYLPTIIQRLSDNLIANGSIVYNNDNEIVKESGDGNRVDVNNESGRFLRDLQLLRQMSEHLTMHLSQSKHLSLQKTTVSEDSVSPVSNGEEGSTSHAGDHGNVKIQNAGLLYSKEADAISTDWSTSDPSTYSERVTTDFSTGHDVFDDGVHGSRSKRSSEGDDDDDDDDDDEKANMRRELHHNKEMEIAHKLHYASVCVVSILVIEVTMKIVCAGSHFLKRKIEVFDAVVIVTSVVVDLIFIKGLTEFAVDDSIFVLALLLPWRVIRVVNSLVMAVIDHEHVKLRLLYSRKKKLDKTVESLRNEVDELKGMLQDIRSFCIKEGIESSRIDGLLGKFAPRRRKDSKFYTLVKLVMSTASINNNDNESISSSSMENDLRHYSNRDSVLNEVASNDGTISSLKQYLSVPFSNGESRSVSDVESVTGDQVNTSPSIYITSPLSEDGGGAMFSFCDVDMEDNDIVTSRHDATECIEEEDSVATIDVTSSTTNINAVGGVAFYVGSQTSFNFGYSQGTTGLVEHAESQGECFNSSSLGGALREAASSSSVDANKNVSGPLFGQFLTVPHCAVNASPGSSTTSISFSTNNNLGNDGGSMNLQTATHSLPQDSAHCEMRRSVSDTTGVTSGYSMCRDVRPRYPYGSPVPVRRSQEGRALRRIYRRHKSESEDNESIGLLKRDSKGRLRRNSGDPQSKSAVGTEEPKRARSHSPSPKTLLNVPVNTRVGGEMTCSSSRSMCDVSFTGNQYAQNLSMDGKILRRSCLSLNSEGRKRRGKSPHRVSFKVS